MNSAQLGNRWNGLRLRSARPGVATGVDFARLIEARAELAAGLPGEPLYGMTPDAGLPMGFTQEAAHV